MTHLDTAPFQALLLQQRASLLAQLATLRGGPVGRAQASAEHFANHEDSTAQTSTARDLELAMDEHETTELAAVEAALQRIETGTYGQCTRCGTDIPPERLRVAPQAPRCITCQELAEQA